MAFSASNSLSLDIPSTGHKHTVSQHVIQNGDPLVAKKNACGASKPQALTSSSAQSIPIPAADSAVTKKKMPQV
jgi:hypothetical protein